MRWLRLLVLALIVPAAGCASSPKTAMPYASAEATPYVLNTGDVLRVTVYGDEELSDLYTVDDSGSVAFPLVGPIPVRGGTTKVAAARISAALANGYMRNPNVAVEVAEYRPFFIQGEVAQSGQYPYVFGMTLRAAISTAGGFSDVADRGRAIIYRRHGDQVVKSTVDLDFAVLPGDTIVVMERWI